jgi:predicted RNA binding protein YcfA (HicA-like mRNA interferase family)
MSQWDKLLKKLYALDPGLRYEELKKILKRYGYSALETKGGSSHVTFRKPGSTPITLPRHTPIKKAYLDLVRQAVEESENESN